jgi:HSP20 family protein
MVKMTRWEPFREMRRMHDMLDQLMDRSLIDYPDVAGEKFSFLPMDVYQTDENVVVKASAPGLKPDDLNISITGDTLTIQGETSEEKEEKGTQYFLKERRASNFSRSITLPTMVKAEEASAEFEDGVLRLTLPKVEEVKPKTITVKAK